MRKLKLKIDRTRSHIAIIIVLMIVSVCFGQSTVDAVSNAEHSVWWYSALFIKITILLGIVIVSLMLVFRKDKAKNIWWFLLTIWSGVILIILIDDIPNVINGTISLSAKIRLISILIILVSVILRKNQVAEIFDKKNIAERSSIIETINSFSAVNYTIEDLIKLAARYVSTCNSNIFHCKYYRSFCKDISSIENTSDEKYILAIESVFNKYFNDGKFKTITIRLPHNSRLTFFIAKMFETLLSTYPMEKEMITTINALKGTNRRNLTNSEIVELYMEIGTKHGHDMSELTYEQKLSLLKMKKFI